MPAQPRLHALQSRSALRRFAGVVVKLRLCAGLFVSLTVPLAAAQNIELSALRLNTAAQGAAGEIIVTSPAEPSVVQAWVATPQAYEMAGLVHVPELAKVSARAERGPGGKTVLRIENLPVSPPKYDLLLVVTGRKTVFLGEYRIDLSGGAREFAVAPVGSQLVARRTTTTAQAARPASAASAAATTPPSTGASAAAPTRTAAPSPATASVLVASTEPTELPALAAASPRAAADRGASGQAAATATPSAPGDKLAQARAAIDSWARSWSGQDFDTYLGMYTSDFAPPGMSHAQWVQQRRDQILTPKSISIGVDNVRTTVQGDTAVAEFDQTRRADGALIRSRKTLELVNVGGRWLITKETNRF
jgi:ketosteroid isomerase-like protein